MKKYPKHVWMILETCLDVSVAQAYFRHVSPRLDAEMLGWGSPPRFKI